MLKIAICDDEAVAIAAARQVLLASDLGAESEIASYTDPAALWKDVQAGKRFDLVLLDVDMPGLDGIELGVHLGDALPEAVLIYLSGQSERVFDAFRARPFRFLQKDHFPADSSPAPYGGRPGPRWVWGRPCPARRSAWSCWSPSAC